MTDAFTVLAHDHAVVKRILDELEAGASKNSGAAAEDLQRRKKTVQRLITEESKHEAVEEQYFWPTVRDLVPDGDQLADQAIAQEQAGKLVLDDLIAGAPWQDRYEALLSEFIVDARAHIAFEEEQVWPRLRPLMTAEQAKALGRKLEAGKKVAPTRPHANTPPRPGLLKAVGPVVAAADRMLDKMTGRNRG